ncbi:MAG: hypothetical protein ACO1NX_08630 [Chitinophagaceae bacterium]
MKRFVSFFAVAAALFFSQVAAAQQDTLPHFSVKNAGGNRVIIGWTNTIADMKQISIQRSHDSLRNYKTILSVADPKAVQNGFVDTQAPNDHMYYRIFYVVGDGMYFFTAAKRPVIDTTRASTAVQLDNQMPVNGTGVVKETPVVKQPSYVPSFYVYTKNDGNVFLNLPNADKDDYRIKFFEESGALLFEIKDIKESGLVLDKANFHRSGWYHFELFKDDKVIEKHRFFIPKSF